MRDRNRIVLRLLIAAACVALSLLAAPCARGQSGPAVTLSSTTVDFGGQLASTTGSAQTVTLTNSGGAPLTFSAITLTGTFAQTNTCPTSPNTLAAGASCSFSITFAPLAGGPTVGLIEIMDNATPATQAITLSGTGEDFSLAASPTSTTVSAGSSGTYTITVTPVGGFNAAVSFACGPLPTGIGCSFSPASVTPNGTSTITTSLSVSTTGSSSAPGRRTRRVPPAGPMLIWTALLIALGGLMAIGRAKGMRPRFAPAALAIAVLLGISLGAPACGGGGSSSSGGGSTSTPAGTYMLLVNGSTPAGTSTLTNPTEVTLVVQ